MLLRETIHKTKAFFHKTLLHFRSFFFRGYHKLPRSLSFSPFSCKSRNARTYTTDQFYNEFYDQWQSDLNRLRKIDSHSISISGLRETAVSDNASTGSYMNFDKKSPEKDILVVSAKEKKHKGNSPLAKMEDKCSQSKNEGAHVLAQKMKELEMIDAGDVEQVLDIEEALHYYSRLTSPVYLDIVDKFFTDMHTDFSVPQSSVPIKNSKRRLSANRL